ncbi:N-acetyltransferase family protein [Actinokineospora sp. HUAS TT18]|uniref:GNAT family N-acetyltransferase n=1 Tax=Actinokineospora sp. HUAS TT18 TaxID=3447451 RepID=UPI003F520EF2
MRVREATQADWARIWPLWHRVVAAGETYMWAPDTSEADARAAWMLPEPAVVFVAEDGADIVGTALLKPNQPGLGDHVANAGFMVDPNRAGEGIGRTLAHHVLSAARGRRFKAMQFNAVVSTNTAAVRLWKSLGFEVVGTVPGAFRHPDGLVDIHIMYRRL